MKSMTDYLSRLEYPGRLIGLASDPSGTRDVVVYAITGRSPSSQARRLAHEKDGIWVQPTDEEILKQGDIGLLVYPAVLFHPSGIAVSNGKQTQDIRNRMGAPGRPAVILTEALATWDYEPDAPIYTPRISGCVKRGEGALSVIRRGDAGETLKSYFEAAIRPGRAQIISTYEGPNREPLPGFSGEPRVAAFGIDSSVEAAESIYDAFGSGSPDRDFRVAVACIFVSRDDPGSRDVHIINRHERTP